MYAMVTTHVDNVGLAVSTWWPGPTWPGSSFVVAGVSDGKSYDTSHRAKVPVGGA